MIFATLTNLVLIGLCIAVVVQNIRVMRRFRDIKKGDLGNMVQALDRSTVQARMVLDELKDILSIDGAANARTIASGESLREELSVMVGIGNAVAERIMEAAANASERKQAAAAIAAQRPAARKRRRSPSRDAVNGPDAK